MKRLFAFGCSFTNYSWSTWADIIGKDFDFFENWGQLGAGNQYIFNSIVECNQHYQFTKNDTVVVCWTNIFREDRYIHDKWRCVGNLYTQKLYDSQWVKEFVTERGHLIRDLASIKAVKTLLEHWQVNWKFLAMVPIDQTDQYRANQHPHNRDVLDLYQDVVKDIAPSYWEVLKDRPAAPFDLHPLPADHLYYVDQILPEFKVSDQTRQEILDEDQAIRLLGKIPPYNPFKIERL